MFIGDSIGNKAITRRAIVSFSENTVATRKIK
jgi:hypothetical protein